MANASDYSQRDRIFGDLADDFSKLINETTAENDRTSIIIFVAFFDDMLRRILGALFIAGSETVKVLLSSQGLLGSYQAKINALYAMGIIAKEEKLILGELGEIRNHFAHNWQEVSLDTQKFKSIEKAYDQLSFEPKSLASPDFAKESTTPRDKLHFFLGNIGMKLIFRIFEAEDINSEMKKLIPNIIR